MLPGVTSWAVFFCHALLFWCFAFPWAQNYGVCRPWTETLKLWAKIKFSSSTLLFSGGLVTTMKTLTKISSLSRGWFIHSKNLVPSQTKHKHEEWARQIGTCKSLNSTTSSKDRKSNGVHKSCIPCRRVKCYSGKTDLKVVSLLQRWVRTKHTSCWNLPAIWVTAPKMSPEAECRHQSGPWFLGIVEGGR